LVWRVGVLGRVANLEVARVARCDQEAVIVAGGGAAAGVVGARGDAGASGQA
jgi:hypothetical protein